MARILAVGERVHDPSLTPDRVRRWELRWRENPLGFMRVTPAMTLGSTRGRLLDLTAMDPDDLKIVNLLSPDNTPGTWDRPEARRNADILADWLCNGEHEHDRVLLLGLKVAAAMGWYTDLAISLGSIGHVQVRAGLRRVPVMCFPHPSGRNRYWNDRHKREEMRSKAKEFLS